MKVAIICPNMSENGAGRAFLLAELLSQTCSVHVYGIAFGNGLWRPLLGSTSVPYSYVCAAHRWSVPHAAWQLSRLIDADVIYASKPLLTSLGLATLIKGSRPLVLDIDDYEVGFAQAERRRGGSLTRRAGRAVRDLVRWESPFWIERSESLIPRADQLTVSNEVLKGLYGGSVIAHVRDEAVFDPRRVDRSESRRALGLPADALLISFIGTPRPHKGLEDLIEAVRLVEAPGAALLVAGFRDGDLYSCEVRARARERLGNRFIGIGMMPFAELPRLLAATDIMAVPQRAGPAAVGQVPAKVFDAMAMETPLVASRLQTIEEAVGDTGWLVEPNSPAAITDAIREILSYPDEALRRVKAGRKRFLERYSFTAGRAALTSVFARYERGATSWVS